MDKLLVQTRLERTLGSPLAPIPSPALLQVGDRYVWQGFDYHTLAEWAAGWIEVYETLLESDVIDEDETIDVVVSSLDREAALAAILAQKAGLPLYTVVLADDQTRKIVGVTQDEYPLPKGWEILPAPGRRWRDEYPDVVAGWAEDEDVKEILADVYQEEDYLLHPHTALSWAVANVYREEAESDHLMVIAAARHPYEKAAEVWEALSGKRLEEDKALKALYLDSGWEPERKLGEQL